MFALSQLKKFISYWGAFFAHYRFLWGFLKTGKYRPLTKSEVQFFLGTGLDVDGDTDPFTGKTVYIVPGVIETDQAIRNRYMRGIESSCRGNDDTFHGIVRTLSLMQLNCQALKMIRNYEQEDNYVSEPYGIRRILNTENYPYNSQEDEDE